MPTRRRRHMSPVPVRLWPGGRRVSRAVIPRARPRGLRMGGQPVRLEVAPLDIRSDWGQRLTASGSIAAGGVAVAALLYPNQANREQQQLAAQGQITDRFGRAIEQLSQEGADIRVGAVYALRRLMRDSPDDEPEIIDILSTFLRTHAATSPTTSTGATSTANSRHPSAPPDIQAAVTVLVHRPNPKSTGNDRLNLADAYLAGVSLFGGGVDLTGADLTGADLTGANLDFVRLKWAHLAGADLAGADLFNADLFGADLTGADLTGTDLTGDPDLNGVDLRDARLAYAKLANADLHEARLTGA